MKHLLLVAALFFSCAINAGIREQQQPGNAELDGPKLVPRQVRITCQMAEGFVAIVVVGIIHSDEPLTGADLAALAEHVCGVLDDNPELIPEAEE